MKNEQPGALASEAAHPENHDIDLSALLAEAAKLSLAVLIAETALLCLSRLAKEGDETPLEMSKGAP